MRSPRGFLAIVVLLLAVPVTLASQVVIDPENEAVMHLMLMLGFVLLSLAVFDFKTQRWMTCAGCAGTAGFAGVLLVQAVSEMIRGDSLHNFAFNVLGQELESGLMYLFLAWCVAMLLNDTRDRTRVMGFVVMSAVVVLGVYTYAGVALGYEAAEVLKLLYVAPLIWFLLESIKGSSPEGRVSPVLIPAS